MAFSTGTIGGGLGLFGSSAIPAATQMTLPVVHQQSTLQDMLQALAYISNYALLKIMKFLRKLPLYQPR